MTFLFKTCAFPCGRSGTIIVLNWRSTTEAASLNDKANAFSPGLHKHRVWYLTKYVRVIGVSMLLFR